MKKRILLVDDNLELLDMLARQLKSEGYSVLALGTPKGIEEKLVQFAPDVVVSDFQMPHADGLDVLLAARALVPRAVRCLLTGATSQVDPLRLAALTPVSMFSKDIDPVLLMVRIRGAAAGVDD